MNASLPLAASRTLRQQPLDSVSVRWAPTLWMLFSRTLLFLLFQALISLAVGWSDSARWWPMVATLANIASIGLLAWRSRVEGVKLFGMLIPQRKGLGRDLLWLLVFILVAGPLGFFPNIWLSDLLLGSPTAGGELMVQSMPLWAAVVSLIFPVTIMFAELLTYFGYALPRLEKLTGRWWLSWLLASAVLSAQHVALPLIFDAPFILWRLVMFLPFALAVGVALSLRPRLFPYIALIHGLMDLQMVLMIIQISG